MTIPPPTNLVYPQTTIAATVGQAITPDTPTVTGTVSSYSISPALPAGLSLNATTGTISGTPTTAAAQTAYTITATNPSGYTTATVTITVTIPAPSNLVYPQTTISAIVGQAITPDTPTVTGTVSSYSISPALPAGLSLNATTGTISGTPTVAATQTAHTITATNAGGHATATVTITVTIPAPSNLVYPQTNIVGTVGVSLPEDLPTVTGTVSSYSISPTLPPGLTLVSNNGLIVGQATGPSPKTTYTVTASNSTGSTTATIQITINLPAPVNLVYPQTVITASVGQAITPDAPSVTGTVSSYSVSPALPAGLNLNTSSGAISGKPTAVAAQTTYTITASNSGGSITASVQITVHSALHTLLELGHANRITAMRFNGSRVLSADQSGHWVLWNYTSGAILASGDGLQPNYPPGSSGPIDMAGQTFVDGIANELEVRALADGHLLSAIAYPGLDNPQTNHPIWWRLASDGSYVCIGSKNGLFVYTLAGQLAISKSGDYSLAHAFAAPGKVLVALGPAGQNLIESISTADGTSTVSPAFSGQFNSWFLDGARFVTNLSTTVWVYSSTGVQQAIVALPTVTNLTGQGDWIWTFDNSTSGYPTYPLEIYPIGSETPAFSFATSVDTTVIPSGTTIGVLPNGIASVSVIDLSGSTPTKVDYPVPIVLSEFAATSSAEWIGGGGAGPLLDGESLSTTARFFGQGTAFSIAGGPSRVAISTAIGKISVFDPNQSTLEQTIDFPTVRLDISADGSVLGAASVPNGAQSVPYLTLDFFSLPSGNVISSFPYPSGVSRSLADFTLSASGTTIGRVLESENPVAYAREVTPITGGSASWSDTGNSTPILLSPDGTLVAVYNVAGSQSSVTSIFKNGTLITAVPGAAVGWIDNNRLLVNQYVASSRGEIDLGGCTIYSAAGVSLATPPLPELKSIQTVDSDSVYDPSYNSIYSLTTGQPVWTASFPSTGVGAVSGANVIYASGHSVVVETSK